MKKPNERIFQLTIEQLGCKAEECLYVDDRERFLYAASRIGMNVVMLNSRHVSFEGNVVNDFIQLKNML